MNFANFGNFRKFLFYLTVSSFLFFCGCSLDGNADYLSSALSEKTREETLKKTLSELEGVEGVSVSIWGKTALIGFSAEDNKDGAEIAGIIRAKALETDEGIEYAAVSRNPEIMRRIGRLQPR